MKSIKNILHETEKSSRRNFLQSLAYKGILLTGCSSWLTACKGSSRQNLSKQSRIVRITHADATDKTTGRDNVNLDADVIKKMVGRGIKTYTGEDSVKAAWQKIIPDPRKKIAIKVNCEITGIYTKSKIVFAVTDGLILRGVPAGNIIIYDLHGKAFSFAGFKKNAGPGIKVGTCGELGGFSNFSWVNLFTPRVRFCKILTGEGPFGCDYLINIPVQKALDTFAGVTISMKNHFGSVSWPYKLHDTMHQSIAEINANHLVANKTRLIIVDGIFTQYKWTAGRTQEFVEVTNQLLFGEDPVSIDQIGWHTIETLRKKHGLKPVDPIPEYINIAASQYSLGNNNLQKIDLIDI